MTGTAFLRISRPAMVAFALLMSSFLAAESSALTSVGQTGTESARSGPAPGMILASFERRHSLYRPRSVRPLHSLHGSRHLRVPRRFLSKNSDRFHLRRQFRGQRDFSSSVNIRVLRRDRAFQNPKIVNSRSLPLLRGHAATSRTLIIVRPSGSRGLHDHPRVRVFRGEALAPGTPAQILEHPYKPVPLPILKPTKKIKVVTEKAAAGPHKEYGFSAY